MKTHTRILTGNANLIEDTLNRLSTEQEKENSICYWKPQLILKPSSNPIHPEYTCIVTWSTHPKKNIAKPSLELDELKNLVMRYFQDSGKKVHKRSLYQCKDMPELATHIRKITGDDLEWIYYLYNSIFATLTDPITTHREDDGEIRTQ